MTTVNADNTVVREIAIKAPARRVFEALTDPDQRKAWWSVAGRFEATKFESDLRVGGNWSMSGTGFSRPFIVKGVYRTIEPPHVLAFTWLPSWQQNPTESLVRFDLTENDGLTTVRLTHSGLTPEGLEAHQGWQQILARLGHYVEG